MTTTAVQDAPPVETDTTLVPSPAGRIGFGLSARNWDEGLRIARTLAKSSLVPKAYFDRPEDVVVAMQYGAEIGLPPMASLQSVAVINGRPGVFGDGFLAVIMASPQYRQHVEYYLLPNGDKVKGLSQSDLLVDETRAVAMFWRRGIEEPFVSEFSIADAKRAKLWGKEGPWSQYPARQMKWRAREFAGRDGFADVLRGVKMVEALADIPPDVVVETIAFPPEPVRLSERASTETTPPPVDSTPATTKTTTKVKTSTTKGKTETPVGPGAGPTVTTSHLKITDTQFVQTMGQDPFYEIRAVVSQEGQPPVGFVFVTREESLYLMAASCEGSDATFTVQWYGSTRQDGSRYKHLTSIAATN